MYIVFDSESIPDGRLIKSVKYNDQNITEEEAIEKAKEDALKNSQGRSDFISPVFLYPVSVCMLKVGDDLLPDEIYLLDEPDFRPQEITRQFWQIINKYVIEEEYETLNEKKASIVSFNGRGFDIPLMEISAFRYGIASRKHFAGKLRKNRKSNIHIDLMDFFTNYGVLRQGYSLNLFSKLLGNPGKMNITGSDVYDLYKRGEIRLINEYCACDVMDTYFIFLRYLVLLGRISLDEEKKIVNKAKEWISRHTDKIRLFSEYLKNWQDWSPWP